MSLVGRRIGKYEILAEVGRGGMGTIYRARDPILDREVAIKVLSPQLASDETFVQRFEFEARSIARLTHPHVVPIYDAGVQENEWLGKLPYLVMQYMEEGGLDHLLQKAERIDTRQALSIIEQVASALDYAHEHGFVHRDVKPANILLDHHGRAYLTDFGLVKAADASLNLTQGQLVGTPAYMAPEQIEGMDISPQTDIYALGIVAYELLTGQVPFQGTLSAVIEGQVRKPPPAPRQLNPELPDGVEAALLKALAKEPAVRYETAGAFAAALGPSLQAAMTASESRRWPVGETVKTQIAEEPPPSESPVVAATVLGTAPPVEQPVLATQLVGTSQPDAIPAVAATVVGTTPPVEQPTPAPQVVQEGTPTPDDLPRWPLILGGVVTILIFLAVGVRVLSVLNSGTGTPIAATTPSEPTAAPTLTTAPITEATPAPEVAASGAVTSLEEVGLATIRIETEGTFVDPDIGLQMDAVGQGSGFIIDPSGLAVTNNHVVTGAGIIRVFIGGERRPRTARVIGVSECSDLAVIDIEGEGFPFFEWDRSEVRSGEEVYAVGFPFGSEEPSFTKGVVSKSSIVGESNWASVRSVIQHDAAINPGSSGGPLVNAEGKVVGVNYARAANQSLNFAVTRDEARQIIDQLQGGQSIDSIGVNGLAVQGSDFAGVWVASVKSGSPADDAGIQAGDIITQLEGLAVGTDGTMSTYCSVLRSRTAEATMDVEVLRFDTQEILEGQLNGRALEHSFSFAQEFEEEGAEPPESGEDMGYVRYTTVTDDLKIVEVEIPAAWDNLDSTPWVWSETGEEVGAGIAASADLDAFHNGWNEPGVFFGASQTLAQRMDEEAILDQLDFSESCTKEGRHKYEDSLYTGFYDLWSDCGGTETAALILAFVPEDRAYVGLVQIFIVTDADLEALDHILDTFVVVGSFQ